MPQIRYQSNFKPHKRQMDLLLCPSRFITASCGRRFGKTLVAMEKVAREACANQNGASGLYWWTAPTFKRSSKAFEDFERALKPIIKQAKSSTYTIILINDVKIEFLSLEKWQNLKGDGLDGVIVDEAARCPHRAWTELLRPALSDKKGWAWRISTPLGKNWFYHEFARGINPTKEFASFTFPTTDNPYIDPKEVASAKREIPEDIFEQEYMARFLEEAAGVFKGLNLCKPTDFERQNFHVCLRQPRPEEVNTLGADLARHRDFTVITNVASAPNARRRVTFFERLHAMDWLTQQIEIQRVANEYRAIAWIDASGPGDRMYEDLIRAGLRVEGFKFASPGNRADLLKTLQVEIANGRVALPDEPADIMTPLWQELSEFEYKLTPGGKLTMGPPDGQHDDCVMSLGLAILGAIKNTSIGNLSDFEIKHQLKIQEQLAQNPAEMHHMLGLPVAGTGQGPIAQTFFGEIFKSPFF